MDFEKKLGRLEEIVHSMEEGDLSLDQSLKLFEEGVKLSRQCHEQLDKAEEKVKVLLAADENGKLETADFAAEEPI
jgi:exodeoxyribonuclease VII small subunit